MVAGEASGDQLGAALISALRTYYPGARFAGVGGERMLAEGFESLFPLERLSVMGFVDPLKRLPELLRMRRGLYRYFLDAGCDLVLGIDSPDFNLGLEARLRARGVLTAHYVSPSVWAWRRGRIRKIARAVDRMLTLFPFETEFYEQHGVPVTFVGHPLADRFPVEPDSGDARARLDLSGDGKLLAIMPGSRRSEVALMGPLFLRVARWLLERHGDLRLVIPAANRDRYRQLRNLLEDRPGLPVVLVEGQSHDAMAASDAVLLTSGTTALEAMLLKKPMVVAYRMGAMTYRLLSRLVKTPYIALPNLIAGRALVPELVQDAATVEALGNHLLQALYDNDYRERQVLAYTDLHRQLRVDAAETAARTLGAMIDERRART
jgi:lipid-A-disaccharide synthase